MEAPENRFLKPFDTVVNFDEDFHCGSETSIKTPLSMMSTIDRSSLRKPTDACQTNNNENKANTVFTVSKRSSPTLPQMHHRSRSKTRGTHRASNRISFSTEQILPQALFHYQLPVSGSSQPPLFQLRSYSPPEREHPYPIKLPLETTGYFSNRRILVTKSTSSEDGPNTIVDVCPELLSMVGGMHNIEDKWPLNSVQMVTDTKYSQMRFTVAKSQENLKQGLNINKSLRERAHSCETVLRKDTKTMYRLHRHGPNNTRESFAHVINSSSEWRNKDVSLYIEAYEAELKSLRKQLEIRSREAEQIAQELVKFKQEEKHTQSRLKDSVYTDSLNEDTILNLKSKIAELYADLESLRCAHTQALDRQADLQEEITTLRRSCDWYVEQLHLTKSTRDKVCSENEKLQMLLRESGEINHRLTHENTCLQTQLVCSRAESVTAKRNLSAQLDAIRIDMIEREALFERFANERTSLEQLCMERGKQVSTLQTQVHHLQTELKTAEELLAKNRGRLEYLELCIHSANSERSELQEKLFHMEQKKTIEDLQLDQKHLSHTAALDRVKELEGICEEKDKALSLVSEEKISLEAELTAAFKEKDTLNNYLNHLKDNLARIEESFDKARYELDSKHMQLTELTDHRDSLCKQIKVLQLQLKDSSESVSELQREKANLTDLVDNYRTKVLSRIDVIVQTDVEQHWAVNHLHIPNQTCTGSITTKAPSAQSTLKVWQAIDSESALGLSEHPNTPRHVDYFDKPQTISLKSLSSMEKNNEGVNHDQIRWKNLNQEYINEIHGKLGHTEGLQNGPTKTDQFHEITYTPGLVHSPIRGATSTIIQLPCEQSSYTALSVTPTPQAGDRNRFTESPRIFDHQDEKPNTPCSQRLEVAPMNYEDKHLRSHEPRPECVALSPLSALEAQLTSYQSESLNVVTNRSINDVCQKLIDIGLSPPSNWADHGSNATQTRIDSPLISYADKDVEGSPIGTTAFVPLLHRASSAFEDGSIDFMDCDSRITLDLPSNDVKGSGEAPVTSSNYCIKGRDTTEDTIGCVPPECQLLLKAVNTATNEATEAVTNFSATRCEVDVKSAMVNGESLTCQETVEVQLHTMEELNTTKNKLNELQSELNKLRSETKGLREEANAWRTQQDAYRSIHASELEALRAIIKTTTEHLTLLSMSLNRANQEKASLQAELARLKGGLRAELERYRLFSQINPTGPSETSIGEENQPVITMMASIGWDAKNLESLLEDGIGVSMLNSKPLNRLNKCFENLQTEITSLEDEIVNHAIAVHDCIHGSQGLNAENAPKSDAITQCCDREP